MWAIQKSAFNTEEVWTDQPYLCSSLGHVTYWRKNDAFCQGHFGNLTSKEPNMVGLKISSMNMPGGRKKGVYQRALEPRGGPLRRTDM